MAWSLCFASCSHDTGNSKMSGTAQKNSETSQAIYKAVETGDVSKLGDYIAADAVDHSNPMGDVQGLDSIKAELAKIHQTATGMKTDVKKTLADEEYVFDWVNYQGTATTADWGMPAGTKYDMNAIHVSKFKDGKVVEHWEYMSAAEMMKMMGAQQPPVTEIKTDTVKTKN